MWKEIHTLLNIEPDQSLILHSTYFEDQRELLLKALKFHWETTDVIEQKDLGLIYQFAFLHLYPYRCWYIDKNFSNSMSE